MPSKRTYKVIGLMSGTSLDGIDLVYVEFQKNHQWHFNLRQCTTLPYSTKWRQTLTDLHRQPIATIRRTEREYSLLLSQCLNDFMQGHSLQPDIIASHGHTVWHQPDNGITLQIGDGHILQSMTKTPIVCDFRSQDVRLGGQGAPLVPIGDQLLFGEYTYCLNLGGFSNLSFSKNDQRRAFDICPTNMALNLYAKKLGKEYDENGQMARSGELIPNLLDHLNALDYYQMLPPKSLGKEWFEAVFLPVVEADDRPSKDVLRTLCEHIAIQIGKACPDGTTLVTGGGAHNSFLMELIRSKSDSHFEIPETKLVDYKEALIFGLLGVLNIRGEVNCLASVTGASRDSVGGRQFH